MSGSGGAAVTTVAATAVHTVRYTSTLLIPVDVVWLPYTSLVLLVIFWLGFDFYRFHEKNKQKYARMRETQVVESSHNRKRINMINCKGIQYKNGLPDFGAVWNTSPSCSDVSSPSPSVRKAFPHSTDISPSDDGGMGVSLALVGGGGGGLRMSDDEDGARTASEISPHGDGVPIPDDRRRLRAPRQAGSGGGSGDRFKGDEAFGSQTSQGFAVGERNDDGTSATLNVTVVQKMKGKRSRERSMGGGEGGGSYDGGGAEGGGGNGGSSSSRQRRAAEDDELRFTDARDEKTSNINDDSQFQEHDGCVVGDVATQTSYTVADLHYNPVRSSPNVSSETVYNHPGVVNPRVLAISPPSQGSHHAQSVAASSSSRNAGSGSPSPHGGGGGYGHSSSSSPRSHRRARHDSPSSSSSHHRSSRPAATAEEFAAQSMDEELNRPIIIDFSRSNSARDERNQDSPSNPATPRHSRRHEPRTQPDDYGPSPSSDRKTYDSGVPKDESVFPGSMRKAPSAQDVIKSHESGASHSRQHSPSYSSSMNAVASSTAGSPSSKSRAASSSVSKRHQHHHHQPQPPPYSSLQQQQQQSLSQHVPSSSSRHSIQVESYDDPPASPRATRSARESRSRDRDSGGTSSSGRKQTETHYRHPQHIDMRDSNLNPGGSGTGSSSSPRDSSSRSARSEKSAERSDSSSRPYKDSSSSIHRHSSSTKHPASSSSSRQVKSARASTSSSSPRNSTGDRRNRKSSDSSKHSSSESPKIPSHFYNQDEEGFFSSMSAAEHNSQGRMDGQQQLPRRGIHFFSQLGTGRRDSLAGFGGGGRKISSSGGGGGGFGEDDGDGGFSSSSGYKGGGFDS